MSKAKDTIRAARALITVNTRKIPHPTPERTQQVLEERHIRHHTPEILYPSDDNRPDGAA